MRLDLQVRLPPLHPAVERAPEEGDQLLVGMPLGAIHLVCQQTSQGAATYQELGHVPVANLRTGRLIVPPHVHAHRSSSASQRLSA